MERSLGTMWNKIGGNNVLLTFRIGVKIWKHQACKMSRSQLRVKSREMTTEKRLKCGNSRPKWDFSVIWLPGSNYLLPSPIFSHISLHFSVLEDFLSLLPSPISPHYYSGPVAFPWKLDRGGRKIAPNFAPHSISHFDPRNWQKYFRGWNVKNPLSPPHEKWPKSHECTQNLMVSFSVERVEGPELELQRLTRADMGAYLCIASNGIPSPVSKRIMVHVHCKQVKRIRLSCSVLTPKLLFQFILWWKSTKKLWRRTWEALWSCPAPSKPLRSRSTSGSRRAKRRGKSVWEVQCFLVIN